MNHDFSTRFDQQFYRYYTLGLDVPGWVGSFREALTAKESTVSSDLLFESGGSRTLINLADQQLAIILLAFVNAGLHTALVNLITTHDDSRLCVRGTILLAKV